MVQSIEIRLYLTIFLPMKRYLLLVMISITCMMINAQENLQDILQRSITERISSLNDYISFMADKSYDVETRQYYKKQALNLFAGRGYEYEENDVRKDGVRINIYSKDNAQPRSMLIRTYLNGLINLKYKKVQIEIPQISSLKLEKIQKIDDNHFICLYNYYPEVAKCHDSISICRDIPQRKIEYYVEKYEVEGGFEYCVLLGDINAVNKNQLR